MPCPFFDHIACCNNANLAAFEPWFIVAHPGWLPPPRFPAPNRPRADLFSQGDGAWYQSDALDTPDKRTAALREFLLALRAHGWFKAWRDEDYPVTPAFVQAVAFADIAEVMCGPKGAHAEPRHGGALHPPSAAVSTKAGVTG